MRTVNEISLPGYLELQVKGVVESAAHAGLDALVVVFRPSDHNRVWCGTDQARLLYRTEGVRNSGYDKELSTPVSTKDLSTNKNGAHYGPTLSDSWLNSTPVKSKQVTEIAVKDGFYASPPRLSKATSVTLTQDLPTTLEDLMDSPSKLLSLYMTSLRRQMSDPLLFPVTSTLSPLNINAHCESLANDAASAGAKRKSVLLKCPEFDESRLCQQYSEDEQSEDEKRCGAFEDSDDEVQLHQPVRKEEPCITNLPSTVLGDVSGSQVLPQQGQRDAEDKGAETEPGAAPESGAARSKVFQGEAHPPSTQHSPSPQHSDTTDARPAKSGYHDWKDLPPSTQHPPSTQRCGTTDAKPAKSGNRDSKKLVLDHHPHRRQSQCQQQRPEIHHASYKGKLRDKFPGTRSAQPKAVKSVGGCEKPGQSRPEQTHPSDHPKQAPRTPRGRSARLPPVPTHA